MRYLVIVMILGSLLLSGCAGSDEKALQYNFKQGITELDISFLENAPPREIYPESEFKFVVQLDNQAAYDATDGVVKIIGLDERYFQVVPLEEGFDQIMGRSLTTPAGERHFLELRGYAGRLLEGAAYYDGHFFLITKYNSKVEFTDTVCINPNLYEVYDAGCTQESQKSYRGQGAPLAVTKVETIITPGGGSAVEYRFHLRNSGQGAIRFINLQGAKLGGEQLFCKFQGKQGDERHVELDAEKQETVLICKKPLRDVNSYTTTLHLDLSYDYEVRQEHTLTLKSGEQTRLFS